MLILFFEKRLKYNKNIKYAIYFFVIILIAFDLLRFASKWQAFDSKNLAFIDLPVTEQFGKISGYERVIGNYGAEVAVYYGLPSIEGYDATYIKRYGEFVASFDNKRVEDFERSIVSFSRNGINTSKSVNLLGAKYVIHKISDGENVWAFPYWNYPKDAFTLIYSDDKYQIYKNNNAYPRVFLVDKYKIIGSPQETLDTMFNNDFNLRDTLVLAKNPEVASVKDFKGQALISQYTPNQIMIKTNSNAKSLLFLSDSYYVGWKAYVDNKESEIYLADYAFRAVVVPQGSHTVTFVYNPLSFRIGGLIAILGVFSCLICCTYLTRSKKVLF